MKNSTNIPYNRARGETLEDVKREIIRISRERPGLYVEFHAVFDEGWFSLSPRFDRYMPGRQSSSWLGGYALNGEFKAFTKRQIIWEAARGISAD